MRRPVDAVTVALVAGLAATVAATAEVTDRVRRVVPLPAGSRLDLDLTNGDVRLVGTTRSDLTVEVERTAPTDADLARFPVEIAVDAAGVRVRIRQDGTDARLTSNVRLDVPRAARIDALRIAEGRLEVADFSGALTAEVRRGPITASRVSGVLRLETGIGDIDLGQVRLVADGLIRARAFNGDLRVAFAERPSDARVMALALNGAVVSAIPLTLKTGWGPRWGEATLGRGEPVVSLDVVSGDIRIEAPAAGRP